jgi:hypothetical protein
MRGWNAFGDAEVDYIGKFVSIGGPVSGFASGEVFKVVSLENFVESASARRV